MKNSRIISVLILLVALTTCDITPVGVGVWAISIETDAGNQNSTWTITDKPDLIISGATDILIEEIDLAGSRITWSTDALDFSNSSPAERVNFRGTVDGNRMAGTVFTQQGNYTVNGTRQ